MVLPGALTRRPATGPRLLHWCRAEIARTEYAGESPVTFDSRAVHAFRDDQATDGFRPHYFRPVADRVAEALAFTCREDDLQYGVIAYRSGVQLVPLLVVSVTVTGW